MSSGLTEQQVLTQYKSLLSEAQQVAGKIAELEIEASEHKLVIDTLTPLDAGRKAYRMVGGVLVERTVGEVLPAVVSNKANLMNVIGHLKERLDDRDAKAKEMQKKYGIKTQKGAPGMPGAQGGQSTGVLA